MDYHGTDILSLSELTCLWLFAFVICHGFPVLGFSYEIDPRLRMPRNYKRKSNRCISQQAIETAIREVTIHNKTVYSVARDLNIPKTSLPRYIKKKQYGSPENMEKIGGYSKPRLVFSGTQEAQLAAYVNESANIYFGLTPREVRKLAYQCAVSFNVEHPEAWHHNKQAGPDWFASFLRRHSSLSVRIPEATSLARATSFNKENVNTFFTKLDEVLDRYHFTAAHIYNVDETGITTVQKPRSIVATKGLKQVGAITSAERGSLITMCLAVNAIGNVVPPMLVFPRVNYRDYFISNGPPCSIGVANKSGWMIAEYFLAYMKHFVEHARPSKEKPVLLLLDNHESHLDINVVEYAKQNGVVLLSFLPHCSHNNETTTDDAQPVEVLTTSTTSDQLTSNPVLANITVVNNGSSETSCDYTEPMKMFSPHSVRPFPKAGERKTTKGGRKKRKTAILTDTPEKQALENEQKLKKTKDPKPNLVRKRLSLKRRPQKTKVKRSSKTAMQDCFCLVCGEPYSNSKSGEQLIQCFGCEDWSHVQCVPSGPGYTCHNCDIDESGFIH